MGKEYIYVLSEQGRQTDLIKVGRTEIHPFIRAQALSKGQPDAKTVEWHMEVPDSRIAEKLAHTALKKYRYNGEYFQIDPCAAVAIIKKKVVGHFKLTETFCYDGDKLRAQAKILAAQPPASIPTAKPKLSKPTKSTLSEIKPEQESTLVSQENLNHLDRLEKFVHDVHAKWQKTHRGLGGLFSKVVGDEGEAYILKILSNKHGFDAVLTPASQTPVDVFGIKWRGYFYHIVMVQVKTSTEKSVYKLNSKELTAITDFGRFVKEEYLNSPLYESFNQKPVAFSVGLANVKNHRPNQPRCTLVEAEFINWYWSKLPRDKVARIKELIDETHVLR